MIDPDYTQTQNTRNGTQNIHDPHAWNIYIYLGDIYLG